MKCFEENITAQMPDNKIIMITLYLYLTNNLKIFFESINKPSRIYSAQN